MQEAHIFWISLEEISDGYALWKAVPKVPKRSRGRRSLAPVVQVGRTYGPAPDPAEVEFEFAASELEKAFAELSSRKSAKDGGATYGEEVEVGSSGLSLTRTERHLYEIWAPCGESFVVRGGALRALVAAVRDLDVSTVSAV